MELKKLAAGAAALATMAGCASPSGGPPGTIGRAETVTIETPTATSSVILRNDPSGANVSLAAPVARAWPALPAAYNALPIPIQMLDTAHHYIRGSVLAYRRFLRNPVSLYVDCGSTLVGPSADSYHVQIRVESQVDPLTASTTNLHTRIDATGSGSGGTVRCSSTGALERLVNDQVKALLDAYQR